MKKFLLIIFLSLAYLSFSQSNTPCSSPTISVSTTCSYSNVQITGSDSYQNNAANFGDVSCGSSGEDVWYNFVAPATGSVEIFTQSGTITDAVMEVYESDCSSFYNSLGCDDDGGTGTMPQIGIGGLTPGQTYYIRLWEYGGGTGDFDVCVTELDPNTPQNCSGSIAVCNDSTFSGNSSGDGIEELDATNQGCLYDENQSSWYNFTASTSGTLSFTISPQNGTDDYDFALWLGGTCPPSTSPNRCSYAASGGGDTGLNNTATDTTENASGDDWVAQLNVVAGQTYVLLIDNFSETTSPFDLSWGGTAILDCSALPVQLTNFNGEIIDENSEKYVKLNWHTNTEYNNDYFTILHSTNGTEWQTLQTVNGSNKTEETDYSHKHFEFENGTNFYKLKQTDFDGNTIELKTIEVDILKKADAKLLFRLNVLGQKVDENYKGLIINYFDDGTQQKVFQK